MSTTTCSYKALGHFGTADCPKVSQRSAMTPPRGSIGDGREPGRDSGLGPGPARCCRQQPVQAEEGEVREHGDGERGVETGDVAIEAGGVPDDTEEHDA